MRDWKSCLIALVFGMVLGSAAAAQEVVPGGWAPQFGYQAFVGPRVAGFGVSGGYPAFGYGVTIPGLSPYYGSGSLAPFSRPVSPPPVVPNAASSQTVNAMDPLIGAIRQSTRRRGSR
jgi:hypothetical protein